MMKKAGRNHHKAHKPPHAGSAHGRGGPRAPRRTRTDPPRAVLRGGGGAGSVGRESGFPFHEGVPELDFAAVRPGFCRCVYG